MPVTFYEQLLRPLNRKKLPLLNTKPTPHILQNIAIAPMHDLKQLTMGLDAHTPQSQIPYATLCAPACSTAKQQSILFHKYFNQGSPNSNLFQKTIDGTPLLLNSNSPNITLSAPTCSMTFPQEEKKAKVISGAGDENLTIQTDSTNLLITQPNGKNLLLNSTEPSLDIPTYPLDSYQQPTTSNTTMTTTFPDIIPQSIQDPSVSFSSTSYDKKTQTISHFPRNIVTPKDSQQCNDITEIKPMLTSSSTYSSNQYHTPKRTNTVSNQCIYMVSESGQNTISTTPNQTSKGKNSKEQDTTILNKSRTTLQTGITLLQETINIIYTSNSTLNNSITILKTVLINSNKEDKQILNDCNKLQEKQLNIDNIKSSLDSKLKNAYYKITQINRTLNRCNSSSIIYMTSDLPIHQNKSIKSVNEKIKECNDSIKTVLNDYNTLISKYKNELFNTNNNFINNIPDNINYKNQSFSSTSYSQDNSNNSNKELSQSLEMLHTSMLTISTVLTTLYELYRILYNTYNIINDKQDIIETRNNNTEIVSSKNLDIINDKLKSVSNSSELQDDLQQVQNKINDYRSDLSQYNIENITSLNNDLTKIQKKINKHTATLNTIKTKLFSISTNLHIKTPIKPTKKQGKKWT